MKILMFLLVNVLLVSCINNQNARLWDPAGSSVLSLSIDLDPITGPPGSTGNTLTGICTPDDSIVSVDCGAGVFTGTCVNGSFSIPTVSFGSSVPVICNSTITDSSGSTATDNETSSAPGIILNVNIKQDPIDNGTAYTDGTFEICIESFYNDNSDLQNGDLLKLVINDHLSINHADVELIVGQDPTTAAGFQNDVGANWATNFAPNIDPFTLDGAILNTTPDGQCFNFKKKDWANLSSNSYLDGSGSSSSWDSGALKLDWEFQSIGNGGTFLSQVDNIELERFVDLVYAGVHEVSAGSTDYSQRLVGSGVFMNATTYTGTYGPSVYLGHTAPAMNFNVFFQSSNSAVGSPATSTSTPYYYQCDSSFPNGMRSISEGVIKIRPSSGTISGYHETILRMPGNQFVKNYQGDLESSALLNWDLHLYVHDQIRDPDDEPTMERVDFSEITVTDGGSHNFNFFMTSRVDQNFTVFGSGLVNFTSIGQRLQFDAVIGDWGLNNLSNEFDVELNYIY